MTQIDQGWGAGPSRRYETLAERFRPIFGRIREGVLRRELGRELPHEPIGWLKQSGFCAVRLPEQHGGAGATLPELFNLLIELAQADSNLAQALRAHFGFVEEVLSSGDVRKRATWLPRIARGETMGSARSEAGAAKLATFSTTLVRRGEGWVLNGSKFYTTGSLYADWVHVGANTPDGEAVTAIVSRQAPGVEVVDDWNGFGQTLTGSGTTHFVEVAVADEALTADAELFAYALPFYQLVHLATLAGIGRAASDEAALAVAARRRSYSHGTAALSSEDPQVLQVVGRVRSAAYTAGAIVLKAAEAAQRAFEVRRGETAFDQSLAIAELESAQAHTVVSSLILEATTILFDALGASATLRPAGLDRHWRNARTIASHNPRIYKDRIVGDYAVNGTPPPLRWRVGEA